MTEVPLRSYLWAEEVIRKDLNGQKAPRKPPTWKAWREAEDSMLGRRKGGLEVGKLKRRRSCPVQVSSWSQRARREVLGSRSTWSPTPDPRDGSSPTDMARWLWGSLPALECSAFWRVDEGRHPSDLNFRKSQETFVACSLDSAMTHPFSKPWLFSKNLCISDVLGVLGAGVRRGKGDCVIL